MADTSIVQGNLRVVGNLYVGGEKPEYTRAEMVQEPLTAYPIRMDQWRVFDAFHTVLPGTPATDDLGLVGGTHGTDVPTLQTEDLKAAGATNKRARCLIVLPPEYEAGQTVQLSFIAGMITTVADVTATIDAEMFLDGDDGLVDGADLVTTAATSINSLTLATKTFAVTSTALSPGDTLDLRLTLAINDAASATVVKGWVVYAALQCDIRG